jgi:hypothetical protein
VDFQYFEYNRTIVMHASNATADQTCGFCRLRIPYALINGTFYVTVNGEEPLYWNYTLHDDGESRWIYFSYQHSTLEIIVIPEFQSIVILPFFIVMTLLAVAIHGERKLLKFGHSAFGSE